MERQNVNKSVKCLDSDLFMMQEVNSSQGATLTHEETKKLLQTGTKLPPMVHGDGYFKSNQEKASRKKSHHQVAEKWLMLNQHDENLGKQYGCNLLNK